MDPSTAAGYFFYYCRFHHGGLKAGTAQVRARAGAAGS